jgi:hypothetical protein
MSDILKDSERSQFKLGREVSLEILNHRTPFISVRVKDCLVGQISGNPRHAGPTPHASCPGGQWHHSLNI